MLVNAARNGHAGQPRAAVKTHASPMLVTLLRDGRARQTGADIANAASPMLVTLTGMVTLVKPMHARNAPSSMLVTLSGMIILSKPLQPLNAPPPVLVTPAGMVCPDGRQCRQAIVLKKRTFPRRTQTGLPSRVSGIITSPPVPV